MVISYVHWSFWDRLIRVKPIPVWSHVPCHTWIYCPYIVGLSPTFTTSYCFDIIDFIIIWGTCNTSFRCRSFKSLLSIFLIIPTLILLSDLSCHNYSIWDSFFFKILTYQDIDFHWGHVPFICLSSLSEPMLNFFELFDRSSLFLHPDSSSRIAPTTSSKWRLSSILLFLILMMSWSYKSCKLEVMIWYWSSVILYNRPEILKLCNLCYDMISNLCYDMISNFHLGAHSWICFVSTSKTTVKR